MREEITKRINKLNVEIKVRHDSIDLLKGRLKNQITSFKETITKVLDKDTLLGEKIRTLFREQGITIASVLMAISVLIEALIPGGGGTGSASLAGGEPPPPKDDKALASLLGKLGMKEADALPGIIGASSVGFSVKLLMQLVGYHKTYGLWLWVLGD